ncbi:hypothetical protein MNEG_8933 [Monoraphidium neglectum]|uniref:Uncharacterized protein n=1 Tax=Monoraphidium neglectum TaxID=145388 RepID=A0A0D2ME64_9CHLO|nr:hypothetical protein MNEG_8933 [Monoraphidium neglectum]KIY99031.1 hypothetical protein MNEG_8933 [Monoraphidium neglectum]|eukprot:XP_013898051.1 hypothetical protein MNEG_8933 [Monoraphidium neglectum]
MAAQRMPEILHGALLGRTAAAAPAAGPRTGAAPASQAGVPAEAVAAAFLSFDRWWRDARCDPALTEHGWDESGATAMVGARGWGGGGGRWERAHQ